MTFVIASAARAGRGRRGHHAVLHAAGAGGGGVGAHLGRPAAARPGRRRAGAAERAAGRNTIPPALTGAWPVVLASGLLFGAVFLSVVASTTAFKVRHNLPQAQWAAGISASPSCSPSGRSWGPRWLAGWPTARAGWRAGWCIRPRRCGWAHGWPGARSRWPEPRPHTAWVCDARRAVVAPAGDKCTQVVDFGNCRRTPARPGARVALRRPVVADRAVGTSSPKDSHAHDERPFPCPPHADRGGFKGPAAGLAQSPALADTLYSS